ncbi:hypothetical protein OROMI_020600 [Orobanche minor]
MEKLNGLRKVRNDEDIRQMQEDMKNETSMKIWIEELSKSETGNPPPSIDDNGEHQIDENDGGANSAANANDNTTQLVR